MDRKWWTLLAVCTGTFMLLLDITVVNVALPAIQRSLGSTFSDLQWVIDAYTLTLAAFLLTAGVIGDIFGRRRLFAIGLAIFSASSLACGLSTSPLMLTLSRGVQGVGGAIMFATSLALIAQAFSGKERGTAFGAYGAVIGGAGAIGPLIGGALTSGIGWRWIFFINIPIGIAAIVVTLAKVQDSKSPTERHIDWIGFVTFSASLFVLVYALVEGNSKGWTSSTILGLLVGSAVLMAIFLVAEWRGTDPMLDLSLFKRPAMVGVSVVAFTLSASIFAMILYLNFYMQDILGYGPLAAGIRFLPITVLAFVISPIAGKLTVKVSSRYLLGLGLILIALGCDLATHVRPNSTWTVLLPGFIVAGFGIGITNPVVASAAVSVVPPEHSGMASGASNTFRQVGIATGIAGLGAVFLSQIRPATVTALAGTPAGRIMLAHAPSSMSGALAEGGVRQVASAIPHLAARQALLSAYRVGFTATFDHLMAIASVVSLIGAVAALALVRQRDFVPSYSPTDAGPTGSPTGSPTGGPTGGPGRAPQGGPGRAPRGGPDLPESPEDPAPGNAPTGSHSPGLSRTTPSP
jgi:EmrB/QacA subfamily drug resistance transporter